VNAPLAVNQRDSQPFKVDSVLLLVAQECGKLWDSKSLEVCLLGFLFSRATQHVGGQKLEQRRPLNGRRGVREEGRGFCGGEGRR
jgi:hypothetical protein